MGIESGETIEAPAQESGVMMSEIAPYLGREERELGVDEDSKPSRWKRKVGALIVAGTVLAGSMAWNPKEAKAGPNFSQEVNRAVGNTLQRASDDVGRSLGNTIGRILGGGLTPREQEEEAKLKLDIIRQQVQQAQQLKTEAARRSWNKQDNLENTQTQLDKELIQQYRQELKDAKTPEQAKFVNEKYKSIIQLPGSSNSSGQWRR